MMVNTVLLLAASVSPTAPTDNWTPITVALMWQGAIFVGAALVLVFTAGIMSDVRQYDDKLPRAAMIACIVFSALAFVTFCAGVWSAVLL